MLFNCKELQKIWNNQINSVTLHLEIDINNKTYKEQTYSYI